LQPDSNWCPEILVPSFSKASSLAFLIDSGAFFAALPFAIEVLLSYGVEREA
jgi:hypothetical protein